MVVGGVLIAAVIAIALVERWLRREEQRLAAHEVGDLAGARTRIRLVRRLVVALIAILAAVAALESTTYGQGVARALLASGAVLALIAGLALRTPLANLAAGVQLVLTQPFRLGDRIAVGDLTGVVDEIKLSYTVLRTDDGRRAYLPNEQLIGTPIVNATIQDPTQAQTVTVPVALDADLAAVAAALREVADAVPGRVAFPAPSVRFAEVSPVAVNVSVTAWVRDADAAVAVGSDLRAAAVTRLRGMGALARQPGASAGD